MLSSKYIPSFTSMLHLIMEREKKRKEGIIRREKGGKERGGA